MPRVIVTRPSREAAHWVQQLRARGIEAAALPLIAIGPDTAPAAQQVLGQARQQLHQYRALMFVSGNAAAYFFESNWPLAPDGKALAATKTRAWAPGPGTARALEQAGVPSSSIDGPAPDAPQFDSEALWQQVSAQIQPGDRVLIVRGRSATPQGAHESAQGSGRDWLARQIEAAGGTVEFVVAYQRGAPQLTDAEVALAHQAAGDGSVWLLSSSEAVAHLGQALPLVDWGAAIALATHPRIAEAARAAGFGTVRECRPALADVVASIESAE
ncbi:MAG: uroporphyrinogen-III synthase [Acidovorax sp.]|uniref:uroporphyrinogen-III synthase n=1 Tax=Acidovorax sp. TaxID=1872122 RepID=UPI00391C2DD3